LWHVLDAQVATNQALSASAIWTDAHIGSLLMAFAGTGNKGVTSTEVAEECLHRWRAIGTFVTLDP
jgi:hypothetical protein